MTLWLNGLVAVPPGDLPLLEDVLDAHVWLAVLKRAVPPERWVDGPVGDDLGGVACVL